MMMTLFGPQLPCVSLTKSGEGKAAALFELIKLSGMREMRDGFAVRSFRMARRRKEWWEFLVRVNGDRLLTIFIMIGRQVISLKDCHSSHDDYMRGRMISILPVLLLTR